MLSGASVASFGLSVTSSGVDRQRAAVDFDMLVRRGSGGPLREKTLIPRPRSLLSAGITRFFSSWACLYGVCPVVGDSR